MSNIIIISGATGGIGSSLCVKIKHPNVLFLLYRNRHKLNVLQKSLSVKNYAFTYEELNDGLIDIEFNDNHSVTDVILVLTAFDILPIKRIEHLRQAEMRESLQTNVLMNTTLILSVLRFAKQQNYTLRIINLDTGAAYRPIEGWSLYSSAKAYINMWLRSIEEEEGIRVVSVDPGVVDTDMQAKIRETDSTECSQVEEFIQYKDMGMLNSPDDVAEFILKRYINEWEAKSFAEKYVKL